MFVRSLQWCWIILYKSAKTKHCNHWWIQGRRARDTHPGPNLSFSCSFGGKLGKIIGWHPHLYGWHPAPPPPLRNSRSTAGNYYCNTHCQAMLFSFINSVSSNNTPTDENSKFIPVWFEWINNKFWVKWYIWKCIIVFHSAHQVWSVKICQVYRLKATTLKIPKANENTKKNRDSGDIGKSETRWTAEPMYSLQC